MVVHVYVHACVYVYVCACACVYVHVRAMSWSCCHFLRTKFAHLRHGCTCTCLHIGARLYVYVVYAPVWSCFGTKFAHFQYRCTFMCLRVPVCMGMHVCVSWRMPKSTTKRRWPEPTLSPRRLTGRHYEEGQKRKHPTNGRRPAGAPKSSAFVFALPRRAAGREPTTKWPPI
jgi:hypothetical protein